MLKHPAPTGIGKSDNKISGIRRDAVEVSVLLGCYAAYVGGF
jgi:hypothetical protein